MDFCIYFDLFNEYKNSLFLSRTRISMKPVSSDPYRWIIIGFQVSYRSDLSFDRTGVKRLEINFNKINLKSIWKFCFQHNFFIRSNLDVKLFPSHSEYFKLPIWIYRFNKFGSGGIAGFLGHSLFRTFILRSIYSISNPSI